MTPALIFFITNKHDGTFEESGFLSGAALSLDGKEQGSMGVDFTDFDHDGKLDIFVTNFTDEPNTLYWNQGLRGFTDISWNAQLAQPSYPLVGWGQHSLTWITTVGPTSSWPMGMFIPKWTW
jgi:hypothetical protein